MSGLLNNSSLEESPSLLPHQFMTPLSIYYVTYWSIVWGPGRTMLWNRFIPGKGTIKEYIKWANLRLALVWDKWTIARSRVRMPLRIGLANCHTTFLWTELAWVQPCSLVWEMRIEISSFSGVLGSCEREHVTHKPWNIYHVIFTGKICSYHLRWTRRNLLNSKG